MQILNECKLVLMQQPQHSSWTVTSPVRSSAVVPFWSRRASLWSSRRASPRTCQRASLWSSRRASPRTCQRASLWSSRRASPRTCQRASLWSSRRASPRTCQRASLWSSRRRASPRTCQRASLWSSRRISQRSPRLYLYSTLFLCLPHTLQLLSLFHLLLLLQLFFLHSLLLLHLHCHALSLCDRGRKGQPQSVHQHLLPPLSLLHLLSPQISPFHSLVLHLLPLPSPSPWVRRGQMWRRKERVRFVSPWYTLIHSINKFALRQSWLEAN